MGSRSIVASLALLLVAGWFALDGLLSSDREVRAADLGLAGQGVQPRSTLASANGATPGTRFPEAAVAPDQVEGNTEVAREAAPAPFVPTAPASDAGFRADAIYGTVLDEAGAPLEDVKVLVVDSGPPGGEATLLAELRTDDAGRFRHSPVPPLEELSLLFEHRERVSRHEVHLPGVEEQFELQPGATIGGRVIITTSGAAQAGVTIRMRRMHWNGRDLDTHHELTTNEEGRYSFDGAAVGTTVRLTAALAGRLPDERTFRVVEGGRDDCDFELGTTVLIAGEVFDLSTGKPIEGAEVQAERVALTTTRSDGRFELERDAQAAEPIWLSVSAPGYCDTHAQWTPESERIGPLRIPLLLGARVEGRVLFEDESPCAGGQIHARTRNRNVVKALYPLYPVGIKLKFRNARSADQALTEADGSYAVTGLLPGNRDAQVSFFSEEFGRADSQTTPVPLPGGVSIVDFTLEASGSIRGRVRQDDEPARARVNWWIGERRGNRVANDGGQFLLRGIPVGEVQLLAKPRDGGRAFGRDDSAGPEGHRVTVAANEEAWVELAILDLNEPIEGYVLDASREPIAGAEVNAWAHDQENNRFGQDSGTTDAEGHFALSVPVMPIPYEVYVSEGARTAHRSGVATGTTNLEFVLPQAGMLALRVVDRVTEESIDGYEVYGRELGKEKFQKRGARGGTVSDAQGFVEFEFPAGTYEILVVARGKGYRDESVGSVTIPAEGERVEREAALSPGTDVVVTFVPAEEGLEPLRASVLLLAEGEVVPASRWRNDLGRVIWKYQEVSPGRNGTPRVAKGFTAGTYRVVAQRGDYEFEPAEIDVPEVDDFAVTVRYRPLAEVAEAAGADGSLGGLGYMGYAGD